MSLQLITPIRVSNDLPLANVALRVEQSIAYDWAVIHG